MNEDDLERRLTEHFARRAAGADTLNPDHTDILVRVRRHHRRRMAVVGSLTTLAVGAGVAALAASTRTSTDVVGTVTSEPPVVPAITTALLPSTLPGPDPTGPTSVPTTPIPVSTVPPTSTTVGTIPVATPRPTAPPPAEPTTVTAPITTAMTPPPYACNAPEHDAVPTPDAATTRQLLIGSWLICDRPSFFGTSDEIGLAIAADGHWAKLARDSQGRTVEMDGAANRGTWTLVDTSDMNGAGHFQINFTGLDGGTRISSVQLIAPAKLLLNNMGLFSARYVKV